MGEILFLTQDYLESSQEQYYPLIISISSSSQALYSRLKEVRPICCRPAKRIVLKDQEIPLGTLEDSSSQNYFAVNGIRERKSRLRHLTVGFLELQNLSTVISQSDPARRFLNTLVEWNFNSSHKIPRLFIKSSVTLKPIDSESLKESLKFKNAIERQISEACFVPKKISFTNCDSKASLSENPRKSIQCLRNLTSSDKSKDVPKYFEIPYKSDTYMICKAFHEDDEFDLLTSRFINVDMIIDINRRIDQLAYDDVLSKDESLLRFTGSFNKEIDPDRIFQL